MLAKKLYTFYAADQEQSRGSYLLGWKVIPLPQTPFKFCPGSAPVADIEVKEKVYRAVMFTNVANIAVD